jgi:hypothetical protein
MAFWLLTHLSTWSLVVVVVGGLTGIAVFGALLVRRSFPALAEGTYNELSGILIGIFAAVYGVLLAFVIVILWEDRGGASAAVSSEAAALSQVLDDSRALPPAQHRAMDDAVERYVRAVTNDEWTTMRNGQGSPVAGKALDDAFAVLRTYSPDSNAQGTFYADAVTSLNQVASNRRARLAASGGSLPTLLTVLVVGGAFAFIPLTYLFGTRRTIAQIAFVGTCTAVIGLGLLLMVVLDRPFLGPMAVDFSPFHSGSLAAGPDAIP